LNYKINEFLNVGAKTDWRLINISKTRNSTILKFKHSTIRNTVQSSGKPRLRKSQHTAKSEK